MIKDMLCAYCARFQGGRSKDGTGKPAVCEAFPKAVPIEIIAGEYDHHNPYPGDNGLLFVAKPGWEEMNE